MSFEIRVDCPTCAIEGSRVETWDPVVACCRLGVPESVRCRLCGHTAEGRVAGSGRELPGEGCPTCSGELDEAMLEAHRCPFCGAHARLEDVAASAPLVTHEALERALQVWAVEEGLATVHDLLEAYFMVSTSREVLDAMMRGEKVETTFDVADYLFSGGGAGGASAAGPAVMREEAAPATQRIPQPVSIRRIGGPRDELLAIASVAAADGEASSDDLTMLARAAEKRGLPLLDLADVRVWRPNEVDPPATLPDRERVLEEMFQMGWSDGQMDDSEMRVIRDFSRAWGIDPERLREWVELYSFGDSNRFERWFRRIGLFLFPAR